MQTDTFTRNELAAKLADRLKLTTSASKETVDFILESMQEALLSNRRVEFRGFGILEAVTRKARTGRNPKNPDAGSFVIPERRTVKFRPGKELSALLNDALAKKTAAAA